MRNYVWTLFAIIFLTITSCQVKIDEQKEKDAILAVIQEETTAMAAMDKEGVFAVHVQDSMETRIELGVHGVNTLQGWDKIKPNLGDATEGWQVDNPVNSKENVFIKVAGNSAWLTCNNVWKYSFDGDPGRSETFQITFLEKIKGDWKISFSAYYSGNIPVIEAE